MKYYILNEAGNPVHEPDEEKWIAWFDTADRSVARSVIGEAQVSTLFLGFGNDGETSVMWETAVLGGLLDGVKREVAGSREQAEAMHAKVVELVRQTIPKD